MCVLTSLTEHEHMGVFADLMLKGVCFIVFGPNRNFQVPFHFYVMLMINLESHQSSLLVLAQYRVLVLFVPSVHTHTHTLKFKNKTQVNFSKYSFFLQSFFLKKYVYYIQYLGYFYIFQFLFLEGLFCQRTCLLYFIRSTVQTMLLDPLRAERRKKKPVCCGNPLAYLHFLKALPR